MVWHPRSAVVLPPRSLIRTDTLRLFGVTPCIGQIRAAEAQMERKTDVVFISGTGSGKTLTFWIPMIYEEESITVLVTALNVLGKQTAAILARAGIASINVTGENASAETFQELRKGKCRLIVVNPELLVNHGGFDELWKENKVTSHLSRVIFDEAHVVSQWGGTFRPDYALLARLRYLLPGYVRFYVASATLPDLILQDVYTRLHLRADTTVIRRSNDRWNCRLIVCKMRHPISSFKDLDFVIPKSWRPGQRLPNKFLIFFNAKKEAEAAGARLRERLGNSCKNHLVWFHSTMTEGFRTVSLEGFSKAQSGDIQSDEVWGLACTDAAGMGLDIADITLVVQWRVPKSLCTLMQRFGRGARDLKLCATCVLLAEPSLFTESKEKRAEGRARREAKKESSASALSAPPTPRPGSWVGSVCMQPAQAPPRAPTPKTPRPRKVPTLKNSDERELEQAMTDFVNAHRLPVPCRRGPPNVFFGNDRIDHEEYCCERCRPQVPPICCDLCNPDLHSMFQDIEISTQSGLGELTDGGDLEAEDEDPEDTETTLKHPTKRHKYNPKRYKSSALDQQLWKDLRAWRQLVYWDYFACNDKLILGPCLVVSDLILQRVVDLTHFGQLGTARDILDQTGWVDELGIVSEMWEIVNAAKPTAPTTPLFTRTPRGAGTPMARQPSGGVARVPGLDTPPQLTPVVRAVTHCSTCGLAGHNVRNKSCPGRPATSFPSPAGMTSQSERTFTGANVANGLQEGAQTQAMQSPPKIMFTPSDAGPILPP